MTLDEAAALSVNAKIEIDGERLQRVPFCTHRTCHQQLPSLIPSLIL